MNPDGLLTNLNPSQNAAVSSFADTLAILAGPGSGKTHTLTSRTAWLLAQGLQPWNVIVATFTVKAAREMKERIGKLIGNGLESKLILGTFHSISRRYLARYGHLIEIRKDFGIADSADSLAIIKRIIKRNNFIIDPKVARSRISGRKSRISEEYAPKKAAEKSVEAQEFETCYAEYEEALKRSNLLDYDDLLLRCVDLLRKYPSCVSNVEAVLIDEFQDTNLVQFDLMRLLAAQRKRITIVGDPDQSIYGFRAAETKNYKRMIRQYPDTVTIALEENYRSSGAILFAALDVIEQDTSRVAKSLQPTHTVGTRPVLRKLANAHKEAEWIISEIQRCKGMTGDLLDLNDIAILLRSSALSRLIEGALVKAGIAYRMVGGLRFYDRVEVKTILDYLRVISQPDNNDALSRIINTPSRRIGETTIKGLLEEADQSKITLWSLILGTVQGKRSSKTKLSTQTEKGIRSFVEIILTARNKMKDAEHRCSTVELIDFVLKKTNYESWLEDHHKDVTKARWENVEELKTQASDFQDLIATGYEDESLPEVEGIEQDDELDPLSRFLATVALASEVKNEEEDEPPTAQVTISTIHAAKGLEWPIVFIPAAYEGSIPHSRSEDSNEERRLLYVAMTRAKALLYMSFPCKNSQGEESTLSPFLSTSSIGRLLDDKGPTLQSSAIQSISHILRRPLPSSQSISKSSELLRSEEDNLFPTGAEDEDVTTEYRWNSDNRNPSFSMGQRPAKRQRIELGRAISNIEESNTTWKRSYSTTMDQSTAFTATSVAFGSARSHLQVLSEHSVNCAIEKELPPVSQDPPKSKVLSKQKGGLAEGQGTLFGFLGKPEPVSLKRSASDTSNIRDGTPTNPYSANINQARTITSTTENTGIAPALSTHRLGTGQKFTRPQVPHPSQSIEQHKRKDYVFLSSSPVRANPPEPEPEEVRPTPGLTSNPSVLPLIRPPITMHRSTMKQPTALQPTKMHSTTMHSTTSLVRPATTMHTTTVQSTSMAMQKTLGVRRSMNGWPPQKGKAYVPPTIRRP